MRTFLLLLLCCLSAIAQAYKPNSINTNVLGTNLFWVPSTHELSIRGVTPSIEFWNTSGASNEKRWYILNGGGRLQFQRYDDNGGAASTVLFLNQDGSIQLSNETNRLSIANDVLLLDGVPIVTGDVTTTNTVINSTTVNSTTINVTTNIFTVGKGGTLVITNAVTPQQIGASKLVGTAADGSLTNLDGVFTTQGSVLYRSATAWTALTPNTAGYVLTDGGAGADPAWAAAAAGGLATSASQYTIVGGAATAAANWTALSNAYVASYTSTPNGTTRTATNRYTVFLLPGHYDMGDSTLVASNSWVDIVGVSTHTGQMEPLLIGAVYDWGDTVLKSTGAVISTPNSIANNDDKMIANVMLYGGTYSLTPGTSGTGELFKMKNVFIHANLATGYGMKDVVYKGNFDQVRCFDGRSFGWRSVGSSLAYFINCVGGNYAWGGDSGYAPANYYYCRAGTSSFGYSGASGNFYYCTAGADSFGQAGFSGKAFNCVVTTGGTVSFAGNGIMSGVLINCYAPSAPYTITGTIANSTFGAVSYNNGVKETATLGFSSTDTTAAVNIASTGWTNTFAKQAVVYFDGTGVTATVYNNAGTALYTNAIALAGGSILLQPSGKVILSGTAITGRAAPF